MWHLLTDVSQCEPIPPAALATSAEVHNHLPRTFILIHPHGVDGRQKDMREAQIIKRPHTQVSDTHRKTQPYQLDQCGYNEPLVSFI